MNTVLRYSAIALLAWTATLLPASAGDKSFAKRTPVLDGSFHEGFAIGRGTTAYSGSPDGSIYKFDLRSGEGAVLVPREPDFDIFTQCLKLGMRVDRRSNLLFVAGCVGGNATVFDADTGAEVMNYQLVPEGSTVINDLAITREAVYFTDFGQPFLYRLPLSRDGRLPEGADAAIPLPLAGDFADDHDSSGFSLANGIVATPDGRTLIVGNSANAQLYRVDPATGLTNRIELDTPLFGFIDGIVMLDDVLFILSPYDPGDPDDVDRIHVVALDEGLLTGTVLGVITDPDLDGVASGALFGDSLYVNNARYRTFPQPDTEYWITRLSIFAAQ